jgi:hypothetical protein
LGYSSVPVNGAIYEILERARILCTRGVGELLTSAEISKSKIALGEIDSWMTEIINTIENKNYE